MAPLMSNADLPLIQYHCRCLEKLEQVPIQPTRFSMAFYVSAVNDNSTFTRYSKQSFMIIIERRMSGCFTCYKIKMNCVVSRRNKNVIIIS